MSILYSLIASTTNVPNAMFSLAIHGDGATTDISIPLSLLPLSIATSRKENNPVDVVAVPASGSVTATLTDGGSTLHLSFSPAPTATPTLQVSVELRYAGI
jgi:hypothetical protein